MKKLKLKKKRFFGLIICLAVIIAATILLLNSNEKLSGEKLTDGVYKYVLPQKKEIDDFEVYDNSIYYLIKDKENPVLYKIDLYTNKSKTVGPIKSANCYLEEKYISCFSEDGQSIHDYNLKKLYKTNDEAFVVPYQDSFLKIMDHKIYLNDELYRTIDSKYKEFDVLRYFVTNDNTIANFVSKNDTYLYNVKDDTYEDFKSEFASAYDDGIYYSNLDTITLKDIINNKVKEYKNNTGLETLYVSAIRNQKLYYIDEGYLKIYDLETEKAEILDYNFDKYVDRMLIDGDYIYIIYAGSPQHVYVIDLNKIKTKPLEEYEKERTTSINKRLADIKKKYNVNIEYRDIEKYDFKTLGFSLKEEKNFSIINKNIDAINIIFKKFDKKFFELFTQDEYKGINIIVAEDIIQEDDPYNIIGYSFIDDNTYTIILSRGDGTIESLLCHELMHTIESYTLNKKFDLFGDWYSFNPSGFDYGKQNYNKDRFIIASDDEAYFVDTYSQINWGEDKARIFENFCSVDKDSILKDYPHLLKKAEYLKKELIKGLPILKDSTVFDSLK